MARLNVLEDSPTQWTATKEEGLKDALQDGTVGINIQQLEIGGTLITATPTEINYVDGVTSNIQTQLGDKADTSSLATVATTGAYSDLSGTPTIPTIDDTAYNSTSWDTNTDGATKNAIRDKIETMDSAIGLNTAKETNTITNITVVEAPTNVEIQSSDGTNDTIAAADGTNAGVMTTTMYDEHVANTAKVSFTWDYDYADLINTPTTITTTQASNIVSNNSFRITPSTIITAGTNITWDGNTLNVSSGTSTDTDAIHDNVANEISALTEKTTPADDDLVLIEDSEASYVKKKVKVSNIGGSSSGGAAVVPLRFSYSGNVSTGLVATIPITDNLAGLDIKEVRISLNGLPTGQALKVDIRRGGTATTDSIFTSDVEIEISTSQTATNSLYITGCSTSGSTIGSSGTTIDAARDTLATDDVLRVYITQVGNILAGADLNGVIELG